MRKQILFRRYCDIGKAQFRFVQIFYHGMHFFDAWRIVPTMQIEPDDHEDLDSFEGVLPPREKWEFRTQTDARTDAQLAREQTLQARAQNKTSAQMASEIAQVHKLTTLLAERVDFLADLACSRHGYMDQVKTRTTAKADKKGLKRRAGDDPLESALETASVPATSGAHTSPMEVDDAVWGATSASSSTTRVPMSVDSAAAKGPSTTEGALPIPIETWPMTSWQQSPFSRMNGPWSRSTSSYRTLTSIICHGGVFSLYMSSYALLMRIQLWLLFAPMRLGWWSTLLSFLVNGLSPLWSQPGK